MLAYLEITNIRKSLLNFLVLAMFSQKVHTVDILHRQLQQESINTSVEVGLRLSTAPCNPSLQPSGTCEDVEPTYFNTNDITPFPEQDVQCIDVSPSEQYDCEWYKEKGACAELDDKYCNVTCGKCCYDKPFPGISCEFVKEYLCDDLEVIQNNYCQMSCGKCTGDVPIPPSPEPQPLRNLSEADIIMKLFENSLDSDPVQSLTGDDPCIWYQVQCNSEGKAEELNLESFLSSYSGHGNKIPPEISQLKFLKDVGLFNNGFVGTIPSEFSVLTNLRHLDFTGNQFKGTIPKELSVLLLLETLDFWNNQITGTIPKELSVLTKLETLDVGWNQVTGTIPKELSELNSLTYFSVAFNQLKGTLPEEYSVWAQNIIANMWFSNNEFSGSIPLQYSAFPRASLNTFPQSGDLCVSQSAPNQLFNAFGSELIESLIGGQISDIIAGQMQYC